MWQWMASIPLDVHPGLDETGANIGQGQSGSVWFLLPNFTGATTHFHGEIPMIDYAPDITYHLTVAGGPQRAPAADGDVKVMSLGAIKAAYPH